MKLSILLGVVVIITSCSSNSSDYKKEDQRENTISNTKECDGAVKSNDPVKKKLYGQKESTPTKRDEIFNTENKTHHNRKAIALNDDAMSYIIYSIPPLTSEDTSLLRKAIALLNKAISIDSLYYLAYANKAMALKHLGQNNEAIQILCIITKLRPDYAEGFSNLGFSYEKRGNMDSAYIKYKSAIIAYNNRIKRSNNLSDKINRAFILSLIDKEKGWQEMDFLIEQNPDDNTIKFWKQQLFEDFDREEFINKQ